MTNITLSPCDLHAAFSSGTSILFNGNQMKVREYRMEITGVKAYERFTLEDGSEICLRVKKFPEECFCLNRSCERS